MLNIQYNKLDRAFILLVALHQYQMKTLNTMKCTNCISRNQ